MSGKNINFGDKKIKKRDFYKKNKVLKIYYIDVGKILVLKNNALSFKVTDNKLLKMYTNISKKLVS